MGGGGMNIPPVRDVGLRLMVGGSEPRLAQYRKDAAVLLEKEKKRLAREERDRLRADLEDLRTRRARIQEGYESGMYKKEEASRKLKELERLEQTAQHQLDELEQVQQTRSEMQRLAAGLAR